MSTAPPAPVDPAKIFRIWPPPLVREIDPWDFGVSTGLGGPKGRDALNPFVRRAADELVQLALGRDHVVVVVGAARSGRARSVYEALLLLAPDAPLLVLSSTTRPGLADALARMPINEPSVLWIPRLRPTDDPGWRELPALLRERGWWLAAAGVRSIGKWARRTLPDIPVVELPPLGAEQQKQPAAPPAPQPRITTDEGPLLHRFSRTVQSAVAELAGREAVTASELAHRLQRGHGSYAGGLLGSARFEATTGVPRRGAEWLESVIESYDPNRVAMSDHQVIDTRLTLRALAALDESVAIALGPSVLAALENECSVPLLIQPAGSGAEAPEEPAEPAEPLAEPSPREHVRWLSDDPAGLDEDLLNREGVAEALRAQLAELVERFPGRSFLVHVDGGWGTGKSTLLRFLRELLGEHDDPWLVVPYDAWRQSKVGPPWLTVLQGVRSAVRTTKRSRWQKAGFWIAERVKLLSRWQRVATALVAVVLGGVLTLIARAGWTVGGSTSVLSVVASALSVGAALVVVTGGVGRFLTLDSRRAADTFVRNRADPMEDLTEHFRWLLSKAGKPVLLLIDDVDRCSEDFVVGLLDAVQKLMRDHDSTSGLGTGKPAEPRPTLLIVVSADGRWVRRSYEQAYAGMAGVIGEPGASVGTAFVEKLFQLTVPVPRLPEAVKQSYLSELLASDGAAHRPPEPDPELAERLRAAPRDQVLDVLAAATPAQRIRTSGVAIDRLVVEAGAGEATRHALEPYAALLDPTPRSMKRFVMTYSMLRAVRTAEASVVGVGPLALWTVLQTRWPLLASFLADHPDAVGRFRQPIERLRETVPAELVPVFADPPADLCAVVNHPDGPLNAATIRECSGQSVRD